MRKVDVNKLSRPGFHRLEKKAVSSLLSGGDLRPMFTVIEITGYSLGTFTR